MKYSDMTPLAEGVFQLEEGHGRRVPEQFEIAVIAFAGCETELTPKKLEEDKEVL